MSEQEIVRANFKEESPHYWTMIYRGYRVMVTKLDNTIGLTIDADVSSDPDAQDWDHVLKTINGFYRNLRIGESKE